MQNRDQLHTQLNKEQCLQSYLTGDLKTKCQFRCRIQGSAGCAQAHQKCMEKELGKSICEEL